MATPQDVRPLVTADEKKDKAGFLGPLYTGPGKNLGQETPGQPKGGKRIPDPLGLKPSGGKNGKMKY